MNFVGDPLLEIVNKDQGPPRIFMGQKMEGIMRENLVSRTWNQVVGVYSCVLLKISSIELSTKRKASLALSILILICSAMF
jgi:hypothetical protein